MGRSPLMTMTTTGSYKEAHGQYIQEETGPAEEGEKSVP